VTKVCNTCSQDKPIDQFPFRPDTKKYRSQCKSCHDQFHASYREKHREKAKQVTKVWREANLERSRKNVRRWRNANLEYARQKENEGKLQKLRTNPNYRLKFYIRNRLANRIRRLVIKQRGEPLTFQLLGCDYLTLRKHLESKFTQGMSWENFDKWHIDHIIPCKSFDLTKEDEQRRCFHYTNLQPLWAKDNLLKGARL
jgi:hypothetical protein